MRRIGFLLSAVCLLLCSCVPIPPGMMPGAPNAAPAGGTAGSYPDVEPGGTSASSLHFTLRGYNDNDLRTISNTAEDIFNKIGTDTGLYSYLAGQTYTIVVYKDASEYLAKTKQPNGSRAVAAGTTLYTYAVPDFE